MISTKTTFKVGIVCGSTRSPRIGPQITSFVHNTIQCHLSSAGGTLPSHPTTSITLQTIDLTPFALPLFDEPLIPQGVTDRPGGYTHAHTRAWSAAVAALDAFVFVTPQYNWGVPAALKNALDFLFHEWAGKPAMVVSYGGHGGGKAAAALVVVCQGLKMRVVERTVGLAFPPDEAFKAKCFSGGDLGLLEEKAEGVWEKERGEIVSLWDEMVSLSTA